MVRTGSLNKAICFIYLRTNSELFHLYRTIIGNENKYDKAISLKWSFEFIAINYIFIS